MKRLVWIALAGLAACSDANVAGTYFAAITNRADGCGIGWNIGAQETDVNVTAAQSGSDVTVIVNGVPGVLLGLQTGTNTFKGEVDGDDLNVSITGTAPKSSGNCSYTINAKLKASLDGDTLTGSVEYRAATNGGSDCGSRTNCVSTQEFNAIRPPS